MHSGPLVVGVGGTLHSNSSTERALRLCLASIERQGGRTKLYCGEDINLPMYNPHDPARTPKATQLIGASAGGRRRHRRLARIPRRRLRVGGGRALDALQEAIGKFLEGMQSM